MSKRLNQEREARLQPRRMETCKASLEAIGYTVIEEGGTTLFFQHNGHRVSLFPYSGWWSGRGIGQGRGFKELLEKLKPEAELNCYIEDLVEQRRFLAEAVKNRLPNSCQNCPAACQWPDKGQCVNRIIQAAQEAK